MKHYLVLGYWVINMKRILLFLLIITLIFPIVAEGAELLLPGQPAPGKGIFFDNSTALRLLEELEECRDVKEELEKYRKLDEVQLALDKVREEEKALLLQRISFLEKNQEELYKLLDTAVKTAEKVSKGPSLTEKVFDAAGWMGIGVLIVKILSIAL